jgi:hypothetical protein
MAIRLLPDALEESNEINRRFNRTFDQLDAARYAIVPDPGQATFAEWVIITGEEEEIREERRVARDYQYRIAAAEPIVVYGSRILLSNFAGVAVSFQINAEIGASTRVSNDPTSSGVAFYQVNAFELRTGASREPISGYEALRRFDLYARSLITKQGVKLISTNIRDWASLENPEWKQLVIDFEVEAESDIALALWDRLNDDLEDFLDTLEGKLTSDLHDLISMTVQW